MSLSTNRLENLGLNVPRYSLSAGRECNLITAGQGSAPSQNTPFHGYVLPQGLVGEFPILRILEALMRLIASVKDMPGTAPWQKNAQDILNELTNMHGNLSTQNITKAYVKELIKLISSSEDIKFRLLALADTLEQMPEPFSGVARKLKDLTEELSVITDTVKFSNQESLKNFSRPVLCFPLSVHDTGKENITLLVYPEFDEEGRVNKQRTYLAIDVETENLGRFRVCLQVTGQKVDCRVQSESPEARELFEKSAHALGERILADNYRLERFSTGPLLDKDAGSCVSFQINC